jgi:rhamnosyltransferase
VVLARKPLMQHAIGDSTIHKLPWKKTGTSNHSPLRRYYRARNLLVLTREYLYVEPTWILSALCSHIKSLILMCLFEEDVTTKLMYSAMGVFDGAVGNFQREIDHGNQEGIGPFRA